MIVRSSKGVAFTALGVAHMRACEAALHAKGSAGLSISVTRDATGQLKGWLGGGLAPQEGAVADVVDGVEFQWLTSPQLFSMFSSFIIDATKDDEYAFIQPVTGSGPS